MFTNNVSPGIANLIRILNFAEESFHIFADQKTTQPLADHDLCFPLVSELKKQYLHPHKAEIDKKWSVLFFTWAHWVPYSSEQIQKLKEEIKKAERIILLYDASFGTHLKRILQQIRDLKKYPQFFRRVNEVCYLTEYPSSDVFSLFKKKFPYHASPMQAFVFDQTLSDQLFEDYNPAKKRSYCATVAGTKGPEFRQKVFLELLSEIKRTKNINVTDSHEINVSDQNSQSVFWAVGENTLCYDAYFQVMRDSDFVFCLPGTYWTPRPVESTACGSIPILGDDYLHSYDIPFEDDVNCVIIKNCEDVKSWSSALNRILGFSDEKILSMRENIHKLRKTHLVPEVYAQRQRKRLGL